MRRDAPRVRLPALLGLVLLPAGAGAADPSPARLQKAIDAILGRPALASASWGIEVRSLQSGKVLYAHDATKDMRPASTLKLVTTAAALDAFGPETRLRTTLETAARTDGLGRVLGDVELVGRGDPELSGRFSQGRITAAFEEMADQLLAAGVRRIEGRIIGREGLFTGERRGEDWSWGDLVWWYGAEVSALSFNDNCADLRLAPGERVGDPIVVDRSPRSGYFSVASGATTSPRDAKKELAVSRAPGSNRIEITGTLPLGAPAEELSVALEDPARYAATVFSEVLESKGVLVAGPVATSSEPLPSSGLRVLAAHDSPPLADVLKGVNKPSQNLHAEMLLRLLGARAKAEGSAPAGLAAVQEFLGRIGAGSERWALEDGSGLSRSDQLAAHDLVSVLAAMDRHRFAAPFRDSLPVAGVDGSLRNRMKGTPAEGRIAAKTGGMRHVAALAGYATTVKGGRLAFAILLNGVTAPTPEALAAIDAIAVALVGSSR